MGKSHQKKIKITLPLSKAKEKFCVAELFAAQIESQSASSDSRFFKAMQKLPEKSYYFEDTLLERHCKKDPQNIHYEVISDDEVGSSGTTKESGKNTRVYSVKGTFKYLRHENKIIYKDRSANNPEGHKERVAKIVPIKTESTIQSIKKEYTLTRLAKHIGMKPPSIFASEETSYACLIMNKLAGNDLYNIIVNDRNWKKRLSTNERIDLSIALLEALEKQVHENGLIHRDLKPENIKVYSDNGRFIVNIFDFDLSKKQSEKESKNEKCGTQGYVSPEMIKQKGTDEKSDIFSIGIILGLIWGADFYPHLWTKKDFYRFKIFSHYRFENMFNDINDLSLYDKAQIKNILLKSNLTTGKKRPYLSELLHVFKEVKRYRSLSYVSTLNPMVV